MCSNKLLFAERTNFRCAEGSAQALSGHAGPKADCNPLWIATAVPAAHAAEARRQVRRCESKANGSSL
ncbi:hypothetical protein D3869_31270 (plasmid) [Azospirillum brasilense]|uniref:Uncharacterized protein n=1 Tax=Azospirillum brasilense TaxID=192 RepID=A0A4D8REK7_AZOBR|nr:hypothetical protein D3869_31270 [Azospirillum brasilense]